MFAVLDIAGQQFKAEKKGVLKVHRLNNSEGSEVLFDKIKLFSDGTKVLVGTPNIADCWVKAKVTKHFQGDKVIVFKKKRRKGYQLLRGHRQQFSEIEVEDITFGKKPEITTKLDPRVAEPKTKNAEKNVPTPKPKKAVVKKVVSKEKKEPKK